MDVLSTAIATLQHILSRRDKTVFLLTIAAIVFVTVVLSLSELDHQSPLSGLDYGLAAFRSLVSSTLILSTDQYLSPPPPPQMLSLAETVATCQPLTDEEQYDRQVKKLASYEPSAAQYPRMAADLREATARALDPRHAGIVRYLTGRVLRPQWSILDLGCGTGEVMAEIQDHYLRLPVQRANADTADAADAADTADASDAATSATTGSAETGAGIESSSSSSESIPGGQVFVGIELVDIFVQETELEMKARGIDMYQGDITDFDLPQPYEDATFDFIMLNDVVEHVQRSRFGCLFLQLQELTHAGSLVYIHTPTPESQLYLHRNSFPASSITAVDDGSNAKEESRRERSPAVLPHHFIVTGMAMAGFELIEMEMDTYTDCGGRIYNLNRLPLSVDASACNVGGYTKYSHMVFRRASDEKIFEMA